MPLKLKIFCKVCREYFFATSQLLTYDCLKKTHFDKELVAIISCREPVCKVIANKSSLTVFGIRVNVRNFNHLLRQSLLINLDGKAFGINLKKLNISIRETL